MAEYRVVPVDQMRVLATNIFQKAGMAIADAETVVEVFIDTDLRGVYTHGCRFIPN